MPAFTSRSCVVPHAGRSSSRTCSGLGLADGPARRARPGGGEPAGPTFTNVRPCRARLVREHLHQRRPARIARRLRASRVRASPDTARSSTTISWFSSTTMVDSLCSQSRRVSATRAWHLATFRTDLRRFALPFWRRASSALRPPQLAGRLARQPRVVHLPPRPTAPRVASHRYRSRPRAPVGGAAWSGTSTTNEAWYRPAASTADRHRRHLAPAGCATSAPARPRSPAAAACPLGGDP